MTWRALYDGTGNTRWLDPGPEQGGLLRGTLQMELDLETFARQRGPLLRVLPRREPRRICVLEPYSDGRVHFLRRHGIEVSQLSVGLGREPISGRMRLSYHWDVRRGLSLLTAENLSKGTIRQQECHSALPLEAPEIAALFGSTPDSALHPALQWLALADHWQTVGPVPGLAPRTEIATPDGLRPIRDLRPGDLVMTADSGPLPVLWQGRISTPSVGSFQPIRIRAPYFGLARDVMLQPSQRVALSGSDIEYYFGESEVIAEARHFVDGQIALWEDHAPVASWHGLVLDRHALIYAGGMWTESLYLGRIANNVELARATAPGALAERDDMPVHNGPVRRELVEYEVQALIQARRRRRSPIAA
ncbi:MAG: Hint domain-containing protein [Paracoccaceae bacterium]